MDPISLESQEARIKPTDEMEKQPLPFADNHMGSRDLDTRQLRLRRRRQAHRTAAAVVSCRLAQNR